MDGEEGIRHPEFGSKIARKLFGNYYGDLCLYHSRSYSKLYNNQPSKLYWADKLSISYEPWWFYLPRAILSGELTEYRKKAHEYGIVLLHQNNRIWYKWAQNIMKDRVSKRK